jgi:hypothetical protein
MEKAVCFDYEKHYFSVVPILNYQLAVYYENYTEHTNALWTNAELRNVKPEHAHAFTTGF